ncbi:MAG TPA: alpha-hydroxy acid oxidase [Xanthobacteraceae bacterium]|nr:alpha-hydroxy acid oxidase [Xanthobacteraceae bacterium]
MPSITSIDATNTEDLRQIARRRIPRALFDYVDRGSYDELTLRSNRSDLDAIRLRQRVLVDVSKVTLATSMLGEPVSMPVAIAPTGMTGLIHGNGEMLGARAAEAAGTKFCLSTMSICTIEDVREVVEKPFWFQLYVFRDRGFSSSVIERARAANCSALFVTVDLPMRGQRHMDIKNGLTVPLRISLRNVIDVATKPAWAMSVLRARRRGFGNVEAFLNSRGGIMASGSWANENYDRTLNWRDIDWVRSLWPGKLVLKGILDVEDAKRAASAGVDAIVVSNHGGRQLDGARSSIASLPDIANAVGDRIEVLFDGGIRSGQDVMKALASGARGCLIGRAFLYGLAAGGEAGVRHVLELIRAELEVSMALTGQCDIQAITRDVIAP